MKQNTEDELREYLVQEFLKELKHIKSGGTLDHNRKISTARTFFKDKSLDECMDHVNTARLYAVTFGAKFGKKSDLKKKVLGDE